MSQYYVLLIFRISDAVSYGSRQERKIKSDSFQFIPLQSYLGPLLSKALPAYHALTGCDTTSAFSGIGKKKSWKVLVNDSEAQQQLATLGEEPLLKNLNSSLVRHLYVLCIPLPKNLLKLTMHGISFSVRRTRQVTICLPHLNVYHITLKEPTSRHISGIQHFVQCRTFFCRTDLGGNWKMMYCSQCL